MQTLEIVPYLFHVIHLCKFKVLIQHGQPSFHLVVVCTITTLQESTVKFYFKMHKYNNRNVHSRSVQT